MKYLFASNVSHSLFTVSLKEGGGGGGKVDQKHTQFLTTLDIA